MMDGKRIRMRRLLRTDGHTVLIALDHGQFKGGLPGLTNLDEMVRNVVDSGADGVILNPGAANAGIDIYAGRAALVLRITGASTDRNPCFDFHREILSVEEAVAAGADAVIAMGFIGGTGEAASLEQLARIAGACRRWRMPLISEMLISVPERFHDLDWIGPATRVAYELGADLVKIYGASEQRFAEVVQESPIPVLAAGGPGKDSPIELAEKVIESGAAGVAFGRSVFGARDAAAVVRELVRIVHHEEGGADAEC